MSTAGSSLTDLAAGIYVYDQTGSAFLVGVTLMATAVPSLVGAGLLAAIDIRLAFWIDSLTFVFSAGCIWFMKTRVAMDAPEEETSVGVVITNLKIGVRTIWDTPMLRSLFLLGAPVFFSFGLWNVLLLPMAIKVLGGTEFQYGIQEGLTSVGFVLGSLFMARYAGRLATGLWIFVGSLGMGLAGVLYGLSPGIWVAIVWVMVSGFFNSPSAVARQTLLQRNTPRELRGRVFSALFVMRDVIFLLGMAGAGLADVIDVRVMIVLASLILVVVALAALVAPGVGRPAAEWRRGLSHLRSTAPAGVGDVRPATRGDFDRLVGRLATFTRLSDPQRTAFIKNALVREVPEGARLVTHGDKASAAYFILEGEAAAGIPEPDGGYRGLSTMGSGDVFGEIAALTGSPRTADVVATRPSRLLEVPAEALRGVMGIPEVNKLLLSTLTERLLRSNQPDLPRLATMDQAALRDLRTKAPTVEVLPRAYDGGS